MQDNEWNRRDISANVVYKLNQYVSFVFAQLKAMCMIAARFDQINSAWWPLEHISYQVTTLKHIIRYYDTTYSPTWEQRPHVNIWLKTQNIALFEQSSIFSSEKHLIETTFLLSFQ